MTRDQLYRETLEKIHYMIEDETDPIAILSTVACELYHAFDHYHWMGFYRVVIPITVQKLPLGIEKRTPEEPVLVVGPYQGTHGCLRIAMGDGVCGTAALTQETQRVPDVSAYPGHIACSTTTQSEIVVPIIHGGETLAVLDVDSDFPDAFDDVDQRHLEALAQTLAQRLAP